MQRRGSNERLPLEAQHEHVTRWHAFATLLIAVACVVGANLFAKARTNPPWLSSDNRIIGTKFERLRELSPDVVVLGDSSAAFGVDPNVLAEELGASAANFATFGRFEVAGAAWTLDEHLASRADGSKPRLVLAVHGARTWWLDADGFTLAQLPLPFGYWSQRAPARTLGPRRTGQALVARWLPLFVQHL